MRRVPVILCLVLSCLRLTAQNDCDSVLDRYEQICDKCIELRGRMAAGEAVEYGAVTGLLGELGKLRAQLRSASGSMTKEQKDRFAAIRARYDGSGSSEGKRTARSGKSPRKASAKDIAPPEPSKVRHERIERLLPSPGVPSLPICTSFAGALAPRPQTSAQSPVIGPSPWRFDAALSFQFNATPAAGFFASASYKALGAFLSARTNFVSAIRESYDIASDGRIEGGGLFWGQGVSNYSLRSICAGPVWHILPSLALYAGAGYADSSLTLLDAGGKWARVSDYGSRGLAAEAGAVLTIGKVNLLAGLWWQREVAFTTGIGWKF